MNNEAYLLFNSYAFIFIFLPIILFGYFWLLRKRLILGSKVWLVAGSLLFYGYWNVIYIPLLLASIFVNFFVGSALANMAGENKNIPSSKTFSSKQLLAFGVLFNVGLLAYFKYTDFLLVNFNGVFGLNIPLPHIILPLGISFFTFTQIAFLVDSYRTEVKEYDLLRYMLFVTYFPHLLAGPILHHKEMMPQFANKWNFALKWRNVAIGFFLFSIGLFKKVVIADTFAQWANIGFDTAVMLNFFEAWATSLSYTLQLYFDFSGYTDMAIGISLMFNIKLPINFNSPYKARDIQDFWRRWHMTLSRFLRDYVYIPLGGNKVSKLRNYINLLSVFIIGGLWHGASWMFVIWGTLHGVAIVIHRAWKDFGLRMYGWLGWLITFNFINITWVFFRAKDFETVKKVIGGMFGSSGIILSEKIGQDVLLFLSPYGIKFGEWLANIKGEDSTIIFIILGIALVFGYKNSYELSRMQRPTWKFCFIAAVFFVCAFLSLSQESSFLYFQF